MAASVCTESLTIGVTSDLMLTKKAHAASIEPIEVRGIHGELYMESYTRRVRVILRVNLELYYELYLELY